MEDIYLFVLRAALPANAMRTPDIMAEYKKFARGKSSKRHYKLDTAVIAASANRFLIGRVEKLEAADMTYNVSDAYYVSRVQKFYSELPRPIKETLN